MKKNKKNKKQRIAAVKRGEKRSLRLKATRETKIKRRLAWEKEIKMFDYKQRKAIEKLISSRDKQ